jgi:hypothetical protein
VYKLLVSISLIIAAIIAAQTGFATNLPISSLPLGPAPSASPSDSLVYTNVTAGSPYRMNLYDLPNLPPFQSEFQYLDPMTTVGDLIYANSTPAPARLAGNASSTKKFLCGTGTGSAANPPSWCTLSSSDVPNNSANTTGTAANLTGIYAIPSPSPSGCVEGNSAGNGFVMGVCGSGSGGGAVPSPTPSTILMGTAGAYITVPFPSPSPSGQSVIALGSGLGFGLGLPGFATNSTNSVNTLNISGGSSGSLPYQSGSGATSFLGIGSSTNLLTISGGVPVWEAIPTWNQNTTGTSANVTGAVAVANGGTGQTSLTANALLVGGGTAAVNLVGPSATAGQVLESGGSSSLPSFQNISIPTGSQGGSVYPAQQLETPAHQLTGLGSSAYLIETGNNNILLNANFQASTVTSGWTLGSGVTGGASFSPVYQSDPSSLQLTLSSVSASTDILKQDVTVTSGSVNGESLEQSFVVNTTVAGLQVCPRIGGADITAYCSTISSAGSWSYTPTSSLGGATTTSVGISIYTPNAVASGTVYVSRGFTGQTRNIGTVSQANIVGGIVISGCSGSWTDSTAGTTPVTPSNPSGCTSTGFDGGTSAGSNLISVTVPNKGPGHYKLEYEGIAGDTTSAKIGYFQFTDGTNNAPELSQVLSASGQQVGVATIQQHIDEVSSGASTFTFSLKCSTDSGGICFIGNVTVPSVIRVYYFPTQAQAVQSVATSPAYSGGTSALVGTTTSTSIADPGSVTGSITPTSSQNISCTAASGYLGITCTGSGMQPGASYHICYGGYQANSTSGDTTESELTNGSNTVIAGIQATTASGANGAGSIGQCADYTASSNTETFKIRGLIITGGTGSFYLNTFSVKSNSTPVNAVTITNGVSTNAAGNWRAESELVNAVSASSCTFSGGTGFIGSSTPVAGGECLLTFSSPFSSPPICHVTPNNTSIPTTTVSAGFYAATTNSTVSFYSGFQSGATAITLNSYPTYLMCQGPR